MRIGMIGLGKMGANMTQRLIRGGHEVVVTDVNPQAIESVVAMGAIGAMDIADMVQKLSPSRIIWLMLPAGDPTESVITQLATMLDMGDIIIDGGNSNYKDTMRRGGFLAQKGIQFVDVGTSGGIWGLDNGYSLMIGGDEAVITSLKPIFQTLAPAPDLGWGRVGTVGSGHFVKMIHNGIEYGMMQAFAEGFAILQAKTDFGLDMSQIAHIWQHGSVVRSWLLDLIADALDDDQILEDIAAFVPDSGEGRWTVFEAIDLNISAPIITLSLERRIRSRENAPYADKLLALMRNQFGGHHIKKQDAD
ncbi:MAG: 6-phosphogluconate dehydrogenase (decarboxylating) [Phototrophicales bacterium]|nr:MAG: 6-phosphogluconate dehydrogenase (decarboxylating) [Phototrophicales bacterium]